MSQDNDAEPVVQPKYTRYRSVRQAAAKESAASAASAAPEQNDLAKRSMSRYRRPRAASKGEQPRSPTLAAAPAIPAIPHAQLSQDPTKRAIEPAPANQSQLVRNISEGKWAAGGPERRQAGEFREQEEQRRRAQRQQEEEQRVLMQTVEEKLAEQKRKDLERLEATLDAAIQAPAQSTVASPTKEKFGFFSRKRAQTKTTPPPAPIPGPVAASGPSSASIARPGGSNETPRKSNEPPMPRAVGPGGTVIVPGTDAPKSAVNAGERRVLVRHKQSSINLPITPGTTALDIFYSAMNIMTHNIAPAAAVLLESYTQLGLERRVRRYERIRDIMNSWDRDTQNALILQNSDSPKFDTDLEAASVPKEPPSPVTVYMYHSQRPSRWQKCYITLLSSGQVFMSKKEASKSSDKDVVNLCHLSDFDIYSPIPSQLRKLKAPKKHCYAVKSQQKTSMFLSTENFVHFFSTDDELLANKWYGAVQRWRSWYLVHRKGEGGLGKAAKKGKKVAGPTTAIPGATAGSAQAGGDGTPYLIGSFQPLFNGGAAAEADAYDTEEDNRPSQIPFRLRNSFRVSSGPSRRDSKRHPPPVAYRLTPEPEEEFASSGLLGMTYSQRLQAQREHETQAQASQNAPPFTDGPSLLNNGPSHRRSLSTRSTRTARPDAQKPLLDFTPQYKEAPQWDKTGKGRGVAAPEGVPLVQVATTMESGLSDIPKTALFTRDGRPATSAGPLRKGNGGGESMMDRGRPGS